MFLNKLFLVTPFLNFPPSINMTNLFPVGIVTWTILLSIIMTLTLPLHPAVMIILMIMYNILICLNISFWKQTYMFSLLYFLIMISSLLIMFLYFSSLISNEKSKNYSNKFILWIILMSLVMTLYNYSYSPSFTNTSHLPWSPSLMSSYSKLPWMHHKETISLMYFPPYIEFTLLNMLFLLVTLLSIIKIISPKTKPMRKIIS